MKNNLLVNTLVICALSVVLFSCKKKEETDTTAPTVTITRPANGDTVAASAIRITATMGDNTDLHEAEVSVISGTDTFLMASPYVHELSTYTYDTTVTPAPMVTSVRAATLMVHVEDHHDNMTMKSVSFFVKP